GTHVGPDQPAVVGHLPDRGGWRGGPNDGDLPHGHRWPRAADVMMPGRAVRLTTSRTADDVPSWPAPGPLAVAETAASRRGDLCPPGTRPVLAALWARAFALFGPPVGRSGSVRAHHGPPVRLPRGRLHPAACRRHAR